jgi:zinc transporter ZupT
LGIFSVPIAVAAAFFLACSLALLLRLFLAITTAGLIYLAFRDYIVKIIEHIT